MSPLLHAPRVRRTAHGHGELTWANQPQRGFDGGGAPSLRVANLSTTASHTIGFCGGYDGVNE